MLTETVKKDNTNKYCLYTSYDHQNKETILLVFIKINEIINKQTRKKIYADNSKIFFISSISSVYFIKSVLEINNVYEINILVTYLHLLNI